MEEKKVLIVDDDRLICLLIEDILEKEGWNFLHVENGEDALDVVGEFKPDVILLDYTMPGMDGCDVFKELIKKNIHSPVIFLTATKDDDLVKKFLSMGAFGYISKPFHSAEIFFTLTKAYDYKNLQEMHRELENRELDFNLLQNTLKNLRSNGMDTELSSRILIDRQKSFILDRFFTFYKHRQQPLLEISNTIETLEKTKCRNEECVQFLQDMKYTIQDINTILSETSMQLDELSERLKQEEDGEGPNNK